MGTFNITDSNLNNQFIYTDENIIVDGNYNLDATTRVIKNVTGNAYAKDENGEKGEFIGNFIGNVADGNLEYSLSQMSRRESNMVWDAIDEIEANITESNGSE